MGDQYTIYANNDGRTRVYDKITKKVTSYPRFLMAAELGRPLTADGQAFSNSVIILTKEDALV